MGCLWVHSQGPDWGTQPGRNGRTSYTLTSNYRDTGYYITVCLWTMGGNLHGMQSGSGIYTSSHTGMRKQDLTIETPLWFDNMGNKINKFNLTTGSLKGLWKVSSLGAVTVSENLVQEIFMFHILGKGVVALHKLLQWISPFPLQILPTEIDACANLDGNCQKPLSVRLISSVCCQASCTTVVFGYFVRLVWVLSFSPVICSVLWSKL